MSAAERAADQLERAFRGVAWHGPSLSEVLDGVDSEQASARPLDSAHTIRELVSHVLVWQKEASARLAGTGRAEVPTEDDWPSSSDEARAWHDLLAELAAAHARLHATVGALTDDELGQTVAGGPPSTAYDLVHGVIQHNLYHAGQIAILKKAL